MAGRPKRQPLTPRLAVAAAVVIGGVLPLATSFSPTDSTMAAWLLVATIGLVLGSLAAARGALPRQVSYALLAALAAFAVACALSATPLLSFLGRYPRFDGLVAVAGYGLALSVGARIFGPTLSAPSRIFADSMAVAAIVTAVVSAVQAIVRPDERVIGLLGNSSILGAWCVAALSILGWRLVAERRVLWLVGFAGAVISLALSASRAAWAGAAVALLAVLILRRFTEQAPRWWIVATALAGLAAVIFLLPSGQARLVGSTPFASATIGGRLLLWGDSLSLVAAHPILGVGPSRFVDALGLFHTTQWAAAVGPYAPPDSPHNLELQLLASTGWLGLVAVAALVGVIGWTMWRRRPWSVAQAAAVTAALGVAVTYQFSYTDPVTLIVVLLAVGGAVADPPGDRPRLGRVWPVLVLAWLAAAGYLYGSALLAEARLSAAVTAAQPDPAAIADVAATRSWDPDLAVRAGRAINQLAEQGGSDAAPAVALLSRTCDQVPDSTECLQALGDALTLGGDPRSAVGALQRALTLDPMNVDTLLKLGIAQAESDDASAAEQSFRRAAQLRPSAAEPWDDLTALFRRQGREQDAADAQRQADSRR
ncbi:O-antigen ligase [Propionicimonas paludicola]|uniref:O-antigen ligase n=1 Tax=Propionicimonas paludicola TaxID=185243 RepID=A0A2A9CPH5_9ACTN|nr:O-antigen ligase family protein [Propionicimonas paludicola]PFG15985.1 O-antigen ligase [Propionicimonas paludicola]